MTPGRVSAVLFFLTLMVRAAGPPPPSPEVAKLISQLGARDRATRAVAIRKLEGIGDEALPALRRAVRDERLDPDVRVRAAAVAGVIHRASWGLEKALGPGAAVTTVSSGYWFNRVRFTADGKHALVAGGGVILYDLKTGKQLARVLEVNGARPALAVSPDGKRALTGHSNSKDYHLLELPSLKVAKTFPMPVYGGHVAVFAPDGASAVVNNEQEPLYHIDLKTGRRLRRFEGHYGNSRCLAFSPDGKELLVGLVPFASSATVDVIVLYDVKTGKYRKFAGHTGSVTGVAFRDGGKQFVTTGDDGTLRVWETKSGKELRKMTHGGRIHDLAVSPDSKRALTAGFTDRLVKVWDLDTGKQLESFEGHMSAVLGVAFSPDGRRALSCDAVACVRLWKLGR